MFVSGKLVARTVALLVTVSAVASAQSATCDIDENKFGKALFALQQARQGKNPEAQAKAYSNIVKDLTAKADNPIERSYALGQVLAAFMANPAASGTSVTRGTLGFTTSPEVTVDPAVLVDSLFNQVEAAKPGCAHDIAQIRRTETWANLVNAAVQAFNSDKPDSAAALANRANLLYPGAPFTWNILAGLAQRKNDSKGSVVYLKKMAAAAGNDTSWADNARTAYGAIGQIAIDAATAAEGAEKAQWLAEAKAAYEALAKDPGKTGNFADMAQSGLARVALAAGDTNAIKSAYQAQLSNPDAYTFQQLLEAGTTAARADQLGDATKLLQAAYVKNPWSRDVLNNLSVMYIRQEQGAKALPLVTRLVEVDPSNPDNFQLLTLAYANHQRALNALSRDVGKRANATQSARLKKALIDSAAALSDSIKRTTNLALQYNSISDTLPVKVTFTNFGPGDEGKYNLGGMILNRSKAPKSYTMVVEFLDEKGQVLATETASVGPVAPNASGKFAVSAPIAAAAGFRYKPLQ
jgi:regulator of sirC expression with transglutaminase-like and TPR domain